MTEHNTDPGDADEVPSRPTPPPNRTVAYGDSPAQVYDVRLPPTAQPDALPQFTGRATVVVVHGGFWRAAYDRGHAAQEAHALACAGFYVAVVEYRRCGIPGGGWPGTAQDLAAAVAAVRADEELPPVVVLLGHSAGGHLVAWAAGQPWADGLAGVVSLGGCVDLLLTDRLGLGDHAARALVGQVPTSNPDAWTEADPAQQAPRVPIVLLHGADDSTVPPMVSQAYHRALLAARPNGPAVEVSLRVIPGCGHNGLIDPEHPAFQDVLAAVIALAEGHQGSGA